MRYATPTQLGGRYARQIYVGGYEPILGDIENEHLSAASVIVIYEHDRYTAGYLVRRESLDSSYYSYGIVMCAGGGWVPIQKDASVVRKATALHVAANAVHLWASPEDALRAAGLVTDESLVLV